LLAIIAAIAALIAILPGFAGVSMMMVFIVIFLVTWFYGVFFEYFFAGRTPGKMIFSLRVVRVDGGPAAFPDYVLRNFLWAVDFLPVFFAIGLTAMFIDRRMRRIGDMVAGTVVVSEEKTRVLGGISIQPPVSEEERQSLPARIDLNNEELAVIEELLRRRPKLSAERVEELATILAPQICERTGLKADTWERALTLAYARNTGKDR
jgi:uncharacterized RDD family membrane protein YckC